MYYQAHLSLKRIIKSSGGCRREGGEGTMLRLWEDVRNKRGKTGAAECADRVKGQVRKGMRHGRGLKENIIMKLCRG